METSSNHASTKTASAPQTSVPAAVAWTSRDPGRAGRNADCDPSGGQQPNSVVLHGRRIRGAVRVRERGTRGRVGNFLSPGVRDPNQGKLVHNRTSPSRP